MGMTQSARFVWHHDSRSWMSDWRAPLIWAAVTIIPGVSSFWLGRPWSGTGLVVLSLAASPPLFRPRPRVDIVDGSTVRVRPKRWFINTYCMFPLSFWAGAVLLTCERVIGTMDSTGVRYAFLVVCAYTGAILSTVLWWRFRGSLRFTGSEVTIGDTHKVSYDGLEMTMTPARTGGFPYLTLSTAGHARTRNLYPTMSYGLEANSVYSLLRHLAETDEETRRSYSPELIREMLLSTPDREVAVGESIEVRIVAQPQASTA